MNLIIGVDFDNTLVTYGELFHAAALERGLIAPETRRYKQDVRDAIRQRANGDMEWQEIQGFIYGRGMEGAELAPGVEAFLRICRRRNATVYIISHKTAYASVDEARVNLRDAALGWMTQRGLFRDETLALSPGQVYFEGTRQEKIARIRLLGCTHFIDDLEDTFLEESFPAHVEKILYAPDQRISRRPGVTAAGSWDEVTALMAGTSAQEPAGDGLTSYEALLGKRITWIERLTGGHNGRVARLTCEDGRVLLAKASSNVRPDGRGRIATEFSAFEFLWEHGVRQIPKPIAVDPEAGCAVYEYIEGRSPVDAGMTVADLEEAVGFLTTLKALSRHPSSRTLPLASEAVFSARRLVETIERRLRRLQECAERGPAGSVLARFLNESFVPALDTLSRWCQTRYARAHQSFEDELPVAARTLSPSDFGFHNALRRIDGRLVFYDFEHFGWDDPAKTIADFVLHPATELAEDLKRRFVGRMVEVFSEDSRLRWRLETLYPLFGLKWCVILLNEFVPEDLERRTFAADRALDLADVQQRQLEKAAAMFARVQRTSERFPYAD